MQVLDNYNKLLAELQTHRDLILGVETSLADMRKTPLAEDIDKLQRQVISVQVCIECLIMAHYFKAKAKTLRQRPKCLEAKAIGFEAEAKILASRPVCSCLLYTSPSPRDGLLSRMPSSA